MSIRTEKVASEIKKTLARPIYDLASREDAGLVTLTTVRVSPDLKIAKVYISIYDNKSGDPQDFIDVLTKKQGTLRHILGQHVRLRFTPELHFFIDDTLDQIEHIQHVLDSVKVDKPADETTD